MANFKTKLQIERKGFVDLFEDVNIPITKSLADIRDLSKRSGGYSTAIEVPATKNNMNLFGHLYDLNITNGSFDLRRKYTCVVIQDDVQTFQGYIKLDSINKYEGPDGETIITFNISLLDNISNFFGKIKDKYINPDENSTNQNNIFGNNNSYNDNKNNIFWDDVIIPKYNYSTIINTFENTYEDIYKFYLPSQTRGWYETLDFKPGIFLYEYLNRIISGVGYSWNGSKTVNLLAEGTYSLIFLRSGGQSYITPEGINSFPELPIGTKIKIYGTTLNDGTYTVNFWSNDGYIRVDELVTNETSSSTTKWLALDYKFIDKENWDRLNKSINLEKLFVPYSGSKDVIKNPLDYQVNAKSDLSYFNDFKGWSFVNSTATLTITWASLIERVKNNGDIIRLDTDSGYIYFKVITRNNDGSSSGIWSYIVSSVDSNFDDITLINSISDFSNITIFDRGTRPMCGNWSNNFTSVGTSDTYFPTPNEYKTYFNNEIIDNYEQFSTVYTASTVYGKFISKQNGNLKIDITQYFDIYGKTVSDAYNYFWSNDNNLPIGYICIGAMVYKNGTHVPDYDSKLQVDSNGNAELAKSPYKKAMQSSQDYSTADVKLDNTIKYLYENESLITSMNLPVNYGDIIEVRLGMNLWRPASAENLTTFRRDNNLPSNGIELGIRPKENSVIKFTITGNYQEDDINLKLKDFLPKKLKQSDFLIGLCKIFNLYIDYDESKKVLLILPRDEYYKLGRTYDWTNKIDNSNKNNVLFIPDLTYKNYIYTYKQDSDTYNKTYNDSTKEIYGQINITFDNDLLVGTTTIDNVFTSTPIARIGGTGTIKEGSTTVNLTPTNGNLLSIIDHSSNVGLKVLYDSNLISDVKSEPFMFKIQSIEPLPSGFSYVYTKTVAGDASKGIPTTYVGYIKYINIDADGKYLYPYIGHLDYPTKAANDLNYALCDYYFYNDVEIVTQNNLFYKHYQRTIRQQSNGKLLKAKFKLTPDELKNIQFYDQFYVFDTYWNLNKITYNSLNDLHEIELISIV